MDFVILSLAAWRLTSLLVHEDGPADIFMRLRAWLGIAYDAQSNRYVDDELGIVWHEIARVFLCLWCASVWVCFVLAAGYWLAPMFTIGACLPLAASAGAIVIERWVRG